MRIGPFGLGTGLILLGLAVDKKKLMKATTLEAHEGDFMAEVGRRDSRRKSIMKDPNIILHPQGVATKAGIVTFDYRTRQTPQMYEPKGGYKYNGGQYKGIVSTSPVENLEQFPVRVVNSYIQKEKDMVLYDYLENTPEYKSAEAGLAKLTGRLTKEQQDRFGGFVLRDWRGQNTAYPFFEEMVSSDIDVKLKKKNEVSKMFKTIIADEIANNYQYYTKGKSIGAMTDEERIACASALGYGEGIAYDENQKAIAPDELNALLFLSMWADGVFEASTFMQEANRIKGQEMKIFSVVKSKSLPDRDIANPFWLDKATQMAIALSKTEDSKEASQPLFMILKMMDEGYKQAEFIEANPHILTVQFPYANRKSFRYHDVDAADLRRKYRKSGQKDSIRAMPTMTMDFAKVKPIIEKNVNEIENYLADVASSGQLTYEEKEKKALASIKRMLPKIATKVMEQVISTSSYIKEEEYEMPDGQMRNKGQFIDTTTNKPQSTVYVSFVPSFNQLDGRTYDFQKRIDGKTEYDEKAMQEWRLNQLASWTSEDMQAFYEKHYQYMINNYEVMRGSRFKFNPSMLALGKLLREFGYEYNKSQDYLAYIGGRTQGRPGDYQNILRILKSLPKGENYKPIDSLTYIARTPKIGFKRIEDALLKAGFSPANADISEGSKCSLGDCLLMVGLGGVIRYPNESRGTNVAGSIERNDQAQQQLVAASKNMARQARQSLSALIATQADVERVARKGMDTEKRYDLLMPYLNNPKFKDKKIA